MRRLFVLSAALACAQSLLAAEIVGSVTRVTDGDTVWVTDAEKVEHEIRFEGVDAPESRQAFGDKATQMLREKIAGKEVRVVWKKRDAFDRLLGHVYVGERWINFELVATGAAWHFKRYSHDKLLADAEVAARAAGAGLWADKSPQAPWDFRAYGRALAKAKKLTPLPSVHSAFVKLATPQAKRTIVQVCDWHAPSAEEFIAELVAGRKVLPTPDEAEQLYEKHLADIQRVQEEQATLLRTMIDITFDETKTKSKEDKPPVVFQENLTPEGVKGYKFLNDLIAKREKAGDTARFREAILRYGATGRLYREGKIKDVLPLEDAEAWKAAYAVKKDGKLVIDKKAMERREDALVAVMLKQTGVVLVVLDGGHDLTDNLQRAGAKVEYLRVETRAYRKLVVSIAP
jgi:endonuclease YncB( thermonuclease family)